MYRKRIILLAAAATVTVSACSEGPAQRRPSVDREVPVIVEPVRYEHVSTRLEAVGTSRAQLSTELYPAASGEVVAVNFQPGQAVRAGDALVELDARKEALAVRMAKLKLEDAERLYTRYRRSADSGAVLPTTLDAARTATEVARVELERAEIALAERTIKAVFDGHVGTTDVDPGDRIGPGTLITTLDDRSTLLVSFEVPETFIGELGEGDAVELRTWSGSAPAFEGEIVDTSSRIDPANRMFVARAHVDNANDELRPGMSFRVNVDLEGERHAVVAEIAAQWGADGAYVWRVVDGAAVRVPVQVVQRRQGHVLIDADFGADDVIVVEGTQRMRDGAVVSYDAERLADARSESTAGGDSATNHSNLD